MSLNNSQEPKIALVSGGARRIGEVICSRLHQQGYDIVLTWRRSAEAATTLVQRLNSVRPDSALSYQLDLAETSAIEKLAKVVSGHYGHLNLLVNNASSYFPTPIGKISDDDWTELISSNARGPLFLAQSLSPLLSLGQGSIVNLLDADIERAIPGHTVYVMAKAALAAMTRSLALELAPKIRVNAVAPGSILWSEDEKKDASHQKREIERCFLGRLGTPEEVAEAVWWLAECATHTTGSTIFVDGGQHLHK